MWHKHQGTRDPCWGGGGASDKKNRPYGSTSPTTSVLQWEGFWWGASSLNMDRLLAVGTAVP